jgi:hypothetical protein
MALFALWHDDAGTEAAEQLHARLLAAAHVVPERRRQLIVATQSGRWHLATFATASHFYPAEAQVWCAADEACVIHGLIWRMEGGLGRLLDAKAVAALLDRPGGTLPDDVAGEYAVLRLHRCGTAEAFGDPVGLHQIFYDARDAAIVASRAAFVAALADTTEADAEAGLWLTAIGYRVGAATGWAGVAQLGQGERLVLDRNGAARAITPFALPDTRGFDEALLDAGIAQAKAAILLAVGDGPVDLPITGGKDSRVVLALALAAGLRKRLTLFTRGYAGHPDVVVGERIAATLGLPHRREPPLGSDLPADLDAAAFMRLLATIAFQADGGMGGWDNVSGIAPGTQTLITGHFGEVLKAYAKRPADGRLEPDAMVRLQGPFDPLGLIRPQARARLVARLAAQMDAHRDGGAQEADLPDLFYWRNRIPNWLGGIRGIKSFERQPVLPLGVPALMRLAFTMTPDERRMELAHFRILQRLAPELIAIPFAHQGWHAGLPGSPATPPVLTPEGAPLFGSWQWSINRNPAVRERLTALFTAMDIPLWEDVDRAALLEVIRARRIDYLEGISLLGLTVAAFHQAGLVERRKLGSAADRAWDDMPLHRLAYAPDERFEIRGHVDSVSAAADTTTVTGWSQVPAWPGASPIVEASIDGRPIASTAAAQPRPDLSAAGIGDGRYGFTLIVERAALNDTRQITIASAGQPLSNGEIMPDR